MNLIIEKQQLDQKKAESYPLFELIHNMDKAEKRYFRLFSSFQGGTKAYMKIFDAIDKKKLKDDDEIFLVVGEVVKDKRTFFVMKRYLYNTILKSMRSFPKNDSNIENDITCSIIDLRFLYNKGLYDQCSKEILKVKRKAYVYERFPELLEIKSLEINLSHSRQDIETFYQKSEEHLLEIKNILASTENLLDAKCADLKFQYPMLVRNFARDFDQRIFQFKDITKQFNSNPPRSITAEIILRILNLITHEEELSHISENEMKWVKLLEESKNNIEFIESENHKHMAEVLQTRYIAMYSNHIRLSMFAGDMKEFKLALEKLEKLNIDSDKLKLRKYNVIYKTQLSYAYTIGEIASSKKYALKCYKYLKNNKRKLTPEDIMTLYALIGRIFFVLSDFKNSLECFNSVLEFSQASSQLRIDLQSNAYLMKLILYYELGETNELSGLATETEIFLRTQDVLYAPEQQIVNLFKTIPFVKDDLGRKIIFENCKQNMEVFKRNKLQSNMFSLFDYITWFDSKITGKSFISIYKSNIKKQK